MQVETHEVDPGLKASALGLKPVESTSPFKVPVSDGSTCTPYSGGDASVPPGDVGTKSDLCSFHSHRVQHTLDIYSGRKAQVETISGFVNSRNEGLQCRKAQVETISGFVGKSASGDNFRVR